MKIVWAKEAQRNLKGIYHYISQDSPTRANNFIHKIKLQAAHLKRFPQMGRVVPELLDQIPPPREIIVQNYRVIYRPLANRIEIVTVSHGSKHILMMESLKT